MNHGTIERNQRRLQKCSSLLFDLGQGECNAKGERRRLVDIEELAVSLLEDVRDALNELEADNVQPET